MPIPKDITIEEQAALLRSYDGYIQDANDRDRYSTGWMPVCIDEYYDNEWAEIKKERKARNETTFD